MQQQPRQKPETRKLRNPANGNLEDALVVDIANIESSPIMVSLADGARMRITLDIFEAARFQSGTDGYGNPLYHLRWGNSIVVVDGPDDGPTGQTGPTGE